MIQKRALRTGDGSHKCARELANGQPGVDVIEQDDEHYWGWNDETMTAEEKKCATIINKTED